MTSPDCTVVIIEPYKFLKKLDIICFTPIAFQLIRSTQTSKNMSLCNPEEIQNETVWNKKIC